MYGPEVAVIILIAADAASKSQQEHTFANSPADVCPVSYT